MKRLVYRPEAVVDVEDAYAWYEKQRSGLGEQFLDALREAEHAVLEEARSALLAKAVAE